MDLLRYCRETERHFVAYSYPYQKGKIYSTEKFKEFRNFDEYEYLLLNGMSTDEMKLIEEGLTSIMYDDDFELKDSERLALLTYIDYGRIILREIEKAIENKNNRG